ncbi:MAG TPA: twin-arginine translocase TatA/TatE family subunit [Candidatus Azoamicus sp. OHIO2]
MGFGNISPLSLLLIFLIIVILFGTKKLRNIGEDLGHAFKSFRKGLNQIDDRTTKLDDDKKDDK